MANVQRTRGPSQSLAKDLEATRTFSSVSGGHRESGHSKVVLSWMHPNFAPRAAFRGLLEALLLDQRLRGNAVPVLSKEVDFLWNRVYLSGRLSVACVRVCCVCLGLISGPHLLTKCAVLSFHFRITTESGCTSMSVPGGHVQALRASRGEAGTWVPHA